jgi:hypothetical protein
MNDIRKRVSELMEDVNAAEVKNKTELEAWRKKYLGAKGLLKTTMAQLKTVPGEEKRDAITVLETFKLFLEAKFEELQESLLPQEPMFPTVKSDDELKKIATDLYDGKIFCDRNVKNQHDIGMVFMPLMLGAFSKNTPKQLEEIGMIYEYLDQQGPRSFNGLPMFMSLRVLSMIETVKMFEFYEQYKKLKEEFLIKS